MQIKQYLTSYNHNSGTVDRIKYIVIHYVGATGGAQANCKYYAEADRSASAHYYVDFDGSVWQSVEDKNIAWHCGAKSYVHAECRNANSIGIELCVRNKGDQSSTSKDWYFEDATVQTAITLTKELMAKYGIAADHVIRHYDVTGKICPNPYVYNHTQHTWEAFKAALAVNKTYTVGWNQDTTGWRYADTTASYYKSCFKTIGDHKYYFGSDGYAYQSKWLQSGEDWYYFDENCYMICNDWEEVGGKWYWFNASGVMVTNTWYEYDGAWYYLGSEGAMCKSQLVENSGKIYAVDADGKMVTGEILVSSLSDGALEYKGLAG